MREADPAAMQQLPELSLADRMLNYVPKAGAAVLSGLAFVAPFEGLVGVAGADAHTAAKSHQVEEYVEVVTKNAEGATVTIHQPAFVFLESCKDGAKQVSRKVTDNKNVQPLGNCSLGKSVTVTPEQPLPSGLQLEPAKRKVLKATRHNNHFIFTEQQEGSTPPASTSTGGSTGSTTPTGTSPSTGNTGNPGGGDGGNPGGSGGNPGGGGGTPENPFTTTGNVGGDIAWTQCSSSSSTSNTMEGSVGDLKFGVVDLEGGLGYSVNTCLASEVADFTMEGISVAYYINTGWYPQSSHIDPNNPNHCATGDENCLAENYGYNNAVQAVQAAESEGIPVTDAEEVDVDLEEDNSWSSNIDQNRASLQGAYDGLAASGIKIVKTYTNPSAWKDLMGNWQNGSLTWFASGANTLQGAVSYCGTPSPTGGTIQWVQFNGETSTGTTGIPLDKDYVCPPASS